MRLLKRFFAWIGKLMRRRRFIGQFNAVPPPVSPPVDISTAILLLLLLEGF